MKKIISVMLICLFVLSFAACGKGGKAEKHSVELEIPDKKVAVLVAPESQYPEDYMAAKALEEQYPDNVVVREYADSRVLVPGDAEIITASAELAGDENIGALVYARATQFTLTAMRKAKEVNPDLYTVAIEPEQGMDLVGEVADLVIVTDWKKYANDIISTAVKMGAEYFVLFSYERQVAGNPLYAQMKKTLADECYSKSINFVYESVQDPNYAGGAEKTRFSVKQGVVKLFDSKKIKGKNVALFSPDSCVQTTLVEECRDRDLIYVFPSFPTAYNGVCEVFKAQVPEDFTDLKTYKAAVTASVNAEEHGGKFALFCGSFSGILVKGAVYSAFDLLAGKSDIGNVTDNAVIRLKDAAGKQKFTAEPYPSYEKTVKCHLAGLEIIEQNKKK